MSQPIGLDFAQLADAIAKAMSQEKSIWDNYVPIIKTEGIKHFYLTEHIETPSVYNEFCHELKDLNEGDMVHLHINNGGGVIDSAVMISEAVQQCKATVIACLTGTVASAATMIALRCDDIQVAPFTQFMIHNYSGGVQGKGKEAKDQMDFVNAEIANTFREIYKDFLTEEEIDDVIDDHDIWMGRNEVLERWAKKKAVEV